jgi:hypothetical protein
VEVCSITKFNFGAPTRQLISKNIGQSDYVGIEKINPESNSVTLRNGRTIQYENLVVAIGQKDDTHSVKGFEEAWADNFHPFYTNADHPSWKSTNGKGYRGHYNFNGGPAYFYIPPGNYYGEIENYNFLIAKNFWDAQARTGKLSWDRSSFTIINPNRTFCKHFKKVDDYLKNACYEHNINIENNLTLLEVRKVPPSPPRTTPSPSSETTTQETSSRDSTATSTPSSRPPPTPSSPTPASRTPPASSTSTLPPSSTTSTPTSSDSETS